MQKSPAIDKKVVAWQKKFGRHNMPWQVKNPYYRWLSEIMLQQTQVAVVRDYFAKFVKAFPTIEKLAAANSEEVMRLWAGLGYYTRARNLLACAKKIVNDFEGVFPKDPEILETLPGIGKSTARAIASFCFNAPTPIMDGNVKRVFSRLFEIKSPLGKASTEKELWSYAEKLVSQKDPGIYNQALMDIGALLCARKKPKCDVCPLKDCCLARQNNTQENYPVRLKKKTKEIRTVRMTLFYKKGAVWVVHRKDKGVWKDLWSLPENLPVTGKKHTEFTHEFSHYTLKACVESIFWTKKSNPTKGGKWLKINGIESEALPSPIKKQLLLFGSCTL